MYTLKHKYDRIYTGLNKWNNSNYRGIFQYTEKLNIPIVVDEVIKYVEYADEHKLIYIIVPDSDTRQKYRKQIDNVNVIIYAYKDFCQFVNNNSKKGDTYCDTLIILDITNPDYYEKNSLFAKLPKVIYNRILGITTKVIKDNVSSILAKHSLPVIDVITRSTAIEEELISPIIIYNVGIDFTSDEKRIYEQLTETISGTINVFKNKAKSINYTFKKLTGCTIDLIEDDFALIYACFRGVQYTNSLNEKVEHVSSEVIRNMLADNMGWTKDLDLSNDYNKQVDMYWNPEHILIRTKAFKEAVDKRLSLFNTCENKKKAINYIIKNQFCKSIFLNKDNSISDYIESIDGAMAWYKGISSRYCYDEFGQPYLYTVGNKKGEPKVFGEQGIKKKATENFDSGRIKAIATSTTASNCFDVEGLTTIVCTHPYCNPFEVVSDKNTRQPYTNMPHIIIWLYMRDFTLNLKDFISSKEKDKLIKAQSNILYDIIWVNDIEDVKLK